MPTEPQAPPQASYTRAVDFPAVARVSRVVELRSVRLARIAASGEGRTGGELVPQVAHDCVVAKMEPPHLEISCECRFEAKMDGAVVAEATLSFALSYDVVAGVALAEADVKEFAFANGTLHAWPFVRQTLFDLTARLGFPPYTVPTFKFVPKASAPPQAAAPPTTPAQPATLNAPPPPLPTQSAPALEVPAAKKGEGEK